MSAPSDLTDSIHTALTAPNPAAAVTLLFADLLRDIASHQRQDTTRRTAKVGEAYGSSYRNSWTAARESAARDLDTLANQLTAGLTATLLPTQTTPAPTNTQLRTAA